MMVLVLKLVDTQLSVLQNVANIVLMTWKIYKF
jgi:hypothetical protein